MHLDQAARETRVRQRDGSRRAGFRAGVVHNSVNCLPSPSCDVDTQPTYSIKLPEHIIKQVYPWMTLGKARQVMKAKTKMPFTRLAASFNDSVLDKAAVYIWHNDKGERRSISLLSCTN